MGSLQRLITLDQRVSTGLAISPEECLLRLLALVAAHSGDSPLWLLGAVAALIWGNTAWQAFGWRVLFGTLTAGAVITLLKWLFRRQRPPGDGRGFYSRFDRHAFPSGHAGRSACIVILLTPLLPSPWISTLLILWVILVGLSRVALQVHFASDIISGWIVGTLVGLTLQIVC